ncbi:hypothetical protein GGX14DRAFT_570707 [Mycena pura]|uniref:Uncharacterized protein n=1 Tax=Mycena pura TaxID=153505 RepID=A0AAD6V4Z4_9AGAR|nr:hypothetical protein GGX14DRAFT_570707 [Mycena pura]
MRGQIVTHATRLLPYIPAYIHPATKQSSNNACLARLGSTQGHRLLPALPLSPHPRALQSALDTAPQAFGNPDGRPTAVYQVPDACVRHAARARGRPGGSREYLKNVTAAWDGTSTSTDMVADLTLGAFLVSRPMPAVVC